MPHNVGDRLLALGVIVLALQPEEVRENFHLPMPTLLEGLPTDSCEAPPAPGEMRRWLDGIINLGGPRREDYYYTDTHECVNHIF